MALIGYSPFANLEGAEISQKKPSWSKDDKTPDTVVSAKLSGANLRYAMASGVFLAYADLFRADLKGADLTNADLSNAGLGGADLSNADLTNADLSAAQLEAADLTDAVLNHANMTYCGLWGIRNRRIELLKEAFHWEKAYYDDTALKALRLQPDQEKKLVEERMKEFQEIQGRKPTVSPPIAPKQK